MKTRLLITLMCLMSLANRSLCAQSPDTEPALSKEDLGSKQPVQAELEPFRVVAFSTNGEVNVASSSLGTLNYPYRAFFKYLECENVIEELELTDTQRKEIKRQLSKIEKMQETVIKQVPQLNVPLSGYADVPIQAFEQINEVLLTHQQRRLDEIIFRTWLRSEGLVRGLLNSPLRTELNITPDQRSRIGRKGFALAQEFAPEIVTFADKSTAQIRDCLSAEQLTQLDAWLGDEYKDNFVAVELLYWQLKYAEDEIEIVGEHNPYEGLGLGCSLFRFAPDGTLAEMGTRNRRPGLGFLHLVTNDPLGRRFLEISEGQIEEFAQLRESIDKDQTRYMELATAARDKQEKEEEAAIRKEWRALIDSIVPRVESILVPFQIERLRTMCDVIGAKQQGLYASLLTGPLSEKINVTEKQKTELRAKAETLMKSILEKSNEFEIKIQEAVFAELDDSQREMLKPKMGQPLKKIPALPTVMLNQFHPLAVKSYVERNRKEQKAIGEKSKSD